jgi:hypothetical protein
VNDERFHVLVERFLEGSLTDAEAQELLAPELRGRLLREATMAGLLARSSGRTDLAPRVLAALRSASDKAEMVRNVMGHLPARRSRWGWVAAAAGFLVAATLVVQIYREPVEAPVVARPEMTPAVRAAVARGVEFVRTSNVPHGPWNGPVPADELILLALHHGGVPASDPHFQSLLQKALTRRLDRTYTVSVQAALLADLDPVAYRDRIAECAKWLVENQSKAGQWAYTTPSAVLDSKNKAGAGATNNSCSLFAVMGLRACARAGVAIPRETLVRARDAWRACQRPDRDREFGKDRAGWCYSREEEDHHPYGSMTAGGLAALISLDTMLGEDWRQDAAARAAMNWLTFHFTVHENYGPVEDLMAKEILSDTPSPSTEFYYYLWALERAASVSGTVTFGSRDWYDEGTHELLTLQRADGSWSSGVRRCNPVWDTCYAILFLTRSTR